jgi:uncharacterized protein DUF3618
MSTQHEPAGRAERDPVASTDPAPVDPDRPYVDGAAASPEELRAEVDRETASELTAEHQERIDAARDDLAATLTELSGRLDPRPRVQAARAKVVDTLRHPAVIGSVAGLVLLVVLGRVRRGRVDQEG